MKRTKQRWGFALLATLAISVGTADEVTLLSFPIGLQYVSLSCSLRNMPPSNGLQNCAVAVLQAAAQSLGQVTAMNGVGTRATGTSGGATVQQPASVAPQLQSSGLSAQSTGSSASASALGQVASSQTTAFAVPQQSLAATSQPSSAGTGVSGQQAAVTGLTTPAAQPVKSSKVPSQGSSAIASVPGQQSAAAGGQSSAGMQMVQQQVAETPYQGSATSARQSAATSLSTSIKAPSRQQADLGASQDTSLAAAPEEDGSKQQVQQLSAYSITSLAA